MTVSHDNPNVIRALKGIEQHPDVTNYRYSVALAELRLAKLVYTAWNGTRLQAHLTQRGREALERHT
jgi:hypothetical protein